MNLNCLFPESFLESADSRRRPLILHHDELWCLRRDALDLAEVFGLVCGNTKRAIWSEHAVNREEKIFGDHATSRMTPLRPGVGKHQMKHSHRFWRQKARDHISNFEPKYPGIGQAGMPNPITRVTNPTQKPFDSQKIPSWILPRHGCQISAIAAAQVHLNWSRAGKNRGEFQGLKVVRGNKLYWFQRARGHAG